MKEVSKNVEITFLSEDELIAFEELPGNTINIYYDRDEYRLEEDTVLDIIDSVLSDSDRRVKVDAEDYLMGVIRIIYNPLSIDVDEEITPIIHRVAGYISEANRP